MGNGELCPEGGWGVVSWVGDGELCPEWGMGAVSCVGDGELCPGGGWGAVSWVGVLSLLEAKLPWQCPQNPEFLFVRKEG